MQAPVSKTKYLPTNGEKADKSMHYAVNNIMWSVMCGACPESKDTSRVSR
jgi:hypothetical protein